MLYILSALISLAFDQLTKLYIMSNFELHQVKPVISGFLQITYSLNAGGAFGMLSKFPIIFRTMSIILSIAGIIFTPRIIKLPNFYQLSLGLIIGGTIGNLIDRLRFGRVVDFIDFSFWPTFNVADIALCTGVGLLAICIYKTEVAKEKEEHSPVQASEQQIEKHDNINTSNTESTTEGTAALLPDISPNFEIKTGKNELLNNE